MKILIISTKDLGGGAYRAAHRLHHALMKQGSGSQMRVYMKIGDENRVVGQPRSLARIFLPLKSKLAYRMTRLATRGLADPFSIGLFGTRGIVDEINSSDADVVNIHFVGGEFMSIPQIGRIRKPIVWTFHDMWAFAGVEHYSSVDENADWRTGYNSSRNRSRLPLIDLDYWVWKRKKKHWKQPFHIITPSKWLEYCVRESALMEDFPVRTIPNCLNLDIYRPWPVEAARKAFNLPLDRKLILFGAIGRDVSGRKGFDLLAGAVGKLQEKNGEFDLVVFGQSRPANAPDWGFPVHYAGRLTDDLALAQLYSAVDVMVVPSRMDNLPQTGTEAQACGCPVVAFDVGGLGSVLEDQVTGFLVPPFDTSALAARISEIASSPDLRREMGLAARERALRLWEPRIVVQKYLETFREAVNLNDSC